MQKNDVKIMTKSGSVVRLLEPTKMKLGTKSVKAWRVERVDSGKKMLCTETSLKNIKDILDKDDQEAYAQYL